jgi:cholestenol delta-isomerase
MATGETEFLSVVSHPYYPLAAIINPYLENEWHFTTLLAVFASGCTAIFTATTLLVRRVRPGLPTSELLTVLWFVLCGCIHLFFEGI